MDNGFQFKSENIKPNDGFGDATPQPVAQSQIVTEFDSANIKPAQKPKEKSKNTLVYITVILGVIALIAITVCIWLLVDKTKTKISETTTTKTSVETPANTEINAGTLGFFTSKIKNPAEGVTYRLGVHRTNSNGNGVFGAYINTENTGVELYIYWEYVGDYYGVDTAGRKNRSLAHITFDQPVADIALGESGQTVGGDVLLFLMKDGTVEYMPIVKALKSNQFESYGKMGGLADIVKFYRTDAIDGNGDFSGYITTLAQNETGEIIDLQGFFRSATTE